MTAVTQCPQCGTRFRVVPDQLKISQGWVRCGKCAEVFNAREAIESAAALKPKQAAQASAVAPQQVSIVLRQQEPIAPVAPVGPVAPPADAVAQAADAAPQVPPVEPSQPDTAPTEPLAEETSPGNASAGLPEVAVVALQQTVAVWVRAPEPEIEPEQEPAPPAQHAEPVSDTATASAHAAAGQAEPDTTPPLHTGQFTTDNARLQHTDWPATDSGLLPRTEPPTPDDDLRSHNDRSTPGTTALLPHTDRLTTDAVLPLHADQPTVSLPVEAPTALSVEPTEVVTPPAPNEAVVAEALPPPPQPQADVGFIRQARRQAAWSSGPARAALVALVMLAGSLLALQVTVHERDRLAVMMPGLKPWLLQLCEPMGCEIGPLRRIEAVEIVSTELVRAKDGSYRFEMGLRNQAALPVAMPAVELSLTDRNGEAVLRRVLLPDDWVLAPGELPAASETNLTLKMSLINPDELRMEGFRALVFYP